ncbi:MAG: GTPase Era [Fimbriimonas sp.]|nr:GTPase Era [Fimbriimonas sp.]
MTDRSNPPYRSGYVALLGKPNVGKSTLLNYIVGQKVSIVSNKPQTTRRRVVGISTTPTYQIAFIDTPGIHEPHTQLAKSMIEQARMSMGDANVIVFVADGSHHPGELDREVSKLLKRESTIPVVLCMNKMDLLKAEDVQRNLDAYRELLQMTDDDFMLTTATRGYNVDRLLEIIVSKLPEQAPLYPDDEFTDQSSRFLAAELIREQILIASRQEIPHAVAVMIDEWEEEGDLNRISASILVEKVSQRAILIGKQGQFLKKIGTEARLEIEKFTGKRAYLQLHVRVSEDWRMSPRILHELEYSD